NFGNRNFTLVEKLHQDPLFRRQSCECTLQEVEATTNVDCDLKLRRAGEQAFIDGIKMLERMTSPPVIVHFVLHDFHEQRPRMRYMTQAAKCTESMQRD